MNPTETRAVGYVFASTEHGQYDPAGQVHVADVDAHNRQVEAEELARWTEAPARMLGYYDEASNTVRTWLGTSLGTIVRWRVYRHNFGGQMVAMTVQGTNGARYYGRASFDTGTCVWLRKGRG